MSCLIGGNRARMQIFYFPFEISLNQLNPNAMQPQDIFNTGQDADFFFQMLCSALTCKTQLNATMIMSYLWKKLKDILWNENKTYCMKYEVHETA